MNRKEQEKVLQKL